MYELKKNGKVLTSKSVGTGPSSYEKRMYRAAVSQRFRNTAVSDWEEQSLHTYPGSNLKDLDKTSKSSSWIPVLQPRFE